MQPEHKDKWMYLILGAVLGAVFGYVAAIGAGTAGSVDIVATAPALTSEQRSGKASLSEAERVAVRAHQHAIVRRLASGEPLTSAEREVILTIALTDQHLYAFSPAEREMITAALK